jgi:hypothetical protein
MTKKDILMMVCPPIRICYAALKLPKKKLEFCYTELQGVMASLSGSFPIKQLPRYPDYIKISGTGTWGRSFPKYFLIIS